MSSISYGYGHMMRTSPAIIMRRFGNALQQQHARTPSLLIFGVVATILLTFMIVYPAVSYPSVGATTVGASSLAATGPASSSNGNAAKRTFFAMGNKMAALPTDDDASPSTIGTKANTNANGNGHDNNNNDDDTINAGMANPKVFPGNVGAALRGARFTTQAAGAGELIGIQIVHRHGARTPIHPAPNQQESWKPLGLGNGQLTLRGRAQHEAFGRKLREQYISTSSSSFLPDKVPGNDIVYVRSTDVDRCLISVQSLLYGLWTDARFPIHTIAEDTETLLQPTDKCVAYRSNYTPVIKRWSEVAQKRYPDIIAKLKTITGFQTMGDTSDSGGGGKKETVKAGNLISIAVDNAACSTTQGIDLDPYFTKDMMTKLRDFTYQMYFEQYGMNYGETDDDKHDIRGPSAKELVRVLLKNFRAKTTKTPPTTRLSIYSAHDTTLVALASSLGLLRNRSDSYYHLLPPFAASMVFELRKKSDGQYYINARYGQPVAKKDGTSLDTYAGWEYKLDDMKLRCGTDDEPRQQCLLTDWAEKIEDINPEPSMETGCCLRSEGFYALGCDNTTKAYAELPHECQMYRRVCPISSCNVGQVMNAATRTCVAISMVGDDSDAPNYEAKSIGIGFMAAGALLCLLAVISRVRNKGPPMVRSLDGTTQYAPVLTLRR